MTTTLPNASTAKAFARYMTSDKGRALVSEDGLAGNAVILCSESETLSDVIERAKLYDPPITFAVGDKRGKMAFFKVAITSDSETESQETVDPGVTMGMLVAYVKECGGHFSFRMSAWQAPLEAEQLTPV